MQRPSIESTRFAQYAGEDLVRWRQLIGGRVVHADSRWGEGMVEDARWASPCAPVAPYLQIRVRYADHGLVAFRAASFSAHHRTVEIPPALDDVLRAAEEEGLDEASREAILVRHDRALREAGDRERLARAEAMRRRAARKRSSG